MRVFLLHIINRSRSEIQKINSLKLTFNLIQKDVIVIIICPFIKD